MDFDSELVVQESFNDVSTILGFCGVSLSLSPFHSHPVVNARHDLSEASEASAAANHVMFPAGDQFRTFFGHAESAEFCSCKTFTW